MVRTAGAPPVVFLTDAVEVEGVYSDAEDRLRSLGPDLLPLAREATVSSGTFLVEVGPAIGEHVLGIPVEVRLGPSWTRGGSVAIPIRWEAVTFRSLFPVLDGTLLVTPLDESHCRLGIEASYRAPLRRIGEVLDRAVLRRVAESTVGSFLSRVAARMSVRSADSEFGA